jgi:dihydrofolate reductase
MRKIIVFTNLTLDGIMQAPGRPDEDTRGGFQHGGWAVPYNAMASSEARSSMSDIGALLMGKRTYEDFYAYWPKQHGNPFTEMLNNMQKYVASTTLNEPLPWNNSTLLKGNVFDAVAEIKAQPGSDILVMGSGVLVQSLMKVNHIDQYVLLIHPLVLGTGRRLFPENDGSANLQLKDVKSTPTGVMVATYQPAEPIME